MRRIGSTGHWAWILATGLLACGGSDDNGLFGKGQGGSPAGGGTGGSVGGSAGTTNGGTGGAPDGGAAGNAATGGGPTGGTGGLGGSAGSPTGGTGGVGGYTVDNICAQYPQKVCAARKSCCEKSYGFNQAQCEATEKLACDALVVEVKNGERTFDASKVDPCLAQVAPLLGVCFFDGSINVALFKAINTCGQIFPGTGAPGSPCSSQTDCMPSTVPNGYFGCSSQNQCYQGTVLSQGAPCNYYLNLCDTGLDCATPSLAVQDGSCQPATPTGGACTSSNQCGLGNYCTSSACQPAKQTGTCSNFHHCASLNCDNGQCLPPGPIVREAQCG